MKKILLVSLLFAANVSALEKEPRTMPQNGVDKALLGQILFFDTALSFNGRQNCATCHNPDKAFIDDRETSAQGMVSQGDDLNKFGRRNSQTMLYSRYAPNFHFDEKRGIYVGGQFWDGRADNLAEQAGKPVLDPLEMGMPNKLEVAKRLYELPMYQQLLSAHYGEQVWASYESVYAAMEDAISTFQHEKKLLAPFDSKYDLFLAGKAELSEKEEKGRQLFFDKSRTNCSSCHQLQDNSQHKEEVFTNFGYYNIGVPSNNALIKHNQYAADYVDFGLFENPKVNGDETQKGKFKVPTLRNIAVTAPYMHNGVFKELKTVLLFLDSHNNPERKINPETGKPWDKAEYAATVAHEELKAKPLSDEDIEALEAFLKALTDERYQEQ